MVIHKIINNNVVSIIDEHGNEQIVMGKGIAFQKKSGDEFDDSLINKRFYLKDSNMNDRLVQLLNEIPMEYINFANSIIEFAKSVLGKSLNDTLYISLSDHIFTAIERYKEGITLSNPMLWEIRRFYEPEYEVGLKVLEMIEERFDVKLPEEEAGSIAMHIVNAEMDSGTMQDVYEITKVIHDISNIVRYYFNMEFDTKSVYYYRFITHIRFFAQRIILRSEYRGDTDDSLFNIIKDKYVNAYDCVLKIEEYIMRNYFYSISDDEKLYLMIHIERVVYKTNQ